MALLIWHTFAELLRDGAAGIQDSLVTTRSAWIAYDSESEINVNLDGEPLVVKVFRSKYGVPTNEYQSAACGILARYTPPTLQQNLRLGAAGRQWPPPASITLPPAPNETDETVRSRRPTLL